MLCTDFISGKATAICCAQVIVVAMLWIGTTRSFIAIAWSLPVGPQSLAESKHSQGNLGQAGCLIGHYESTPSCIALSLLHQTFFTLLPLQIPKMCFDRDMLLTSRFNPCVVFYYVEQQREPPNDLS